MDDRLYIEQSKKEKEKDTLRAVGFSHAE